MSDHVEFHLREILASAGLILLAAPKHRNGANGSKASTPTTGIPTSDPSPPSAAGVAGHGAPQSGAH